MLQNSFKHWKAFDYLNEITDCIIIIDTNATFKLIFLLNFKLLGGEVVSTHTYEVSEQTYIVLSSASPVSKY